MLKRRYYKHRLHKYTQQILPTIAITTNNTTERKLSICSEFRDADESVKTCSKDMKNVSCSATFALNITENGNCKVTPELNETPRHKDVRGNEGTAANILSLGTTCRCVVSFTPKPF
jgi:hypothetical protein